MTAALKVLGYDGAEVGKHDGLTGAIANASIELAEATGQVEPTKWNNAFYDKRVPASELWYRRSMADETEENGVSVRRVLAELKQEKEAA